MAAIDVSVILPFRNAEDTLASAIQSILDQLLENFELILIDNASSDRSLEIAHSFQDSRIRIAEEPKIGVVHASNKGLDLAIGRFIARMDADDISLPNRLKSEFDLLMENPELGIASGLVETIADQTEGFQRYLNWINELRTPHELFLNQFVEYPMVNPSIMLRSELVQKFGGYREGSFPEDYEFFLRLMSEGVKMQKVQEVVLRWNDLPTRLTRTSSVYSEEAFNRIKSKYLAIWLVSNNPHHPEVWVWGAGKQSRKKAHELRKHGIQIVGYVEVNEKQSSGEYPVIHYSTLSNADRFIVSYVSNWGAREEIRTFLKERGWIEGQNFMLAG